MAGIQDLTNLINQVVTEKTFTADALAGIQKIKERAEVLQSELNDTTKSLERANTSLQEYKDRENDNYLLKARLDERDKALTEREKKMTELELKAAVAMAESRILDRTMDRFLGNRQIRETLTSSVPITRHYSGSGGDVVENHTKTDTVVREER